MPLRSAFARMGATSSGDNQTRFNAFVIATTASGGRASRTPLIVNPAVLSRGAGSAVLAGAADGRQFVRDSRAIWDGS
jgi:hypothetical protein